MKVLYFIVCLLLVACSGDNQPEVNQPFELKNIIVGDQQNQQTFENVAPNVAIVLEFSDAVDEASARNNIALKHEELPVSYNPQIQISAESETKRSIFREKDKTKRSKKESAQHSKSRNKSFVMTSVSAL